MNSNMLCSKCGKRPAVVFISKIQGDDSTQEGLCLKCAMEMNIGPIKQFMDKMGITEEEVEAFLNSLKGIDGKRASVNTREQYLNLLKTVFKFCIKRGQIPATYNPVANLNPPGKTKIEEPETLSVEEVKRIFAFVKNTPRYHKFIPVLAVEFFCGARVEE